MVLPANHPGQHSVNAIPRPDESLTGYIFRLAVRRRLSSALLLAKSVGFNRFTNRPRREWLEALAESARVSFDDLEAISFGLSDSASGRFRGVELPALVFEHRGASDRRLCPFCLQDRPHHRAIWDLIFIAVCPIHAVRLVDACRTCGEPVRWSGLGLTSCGCNAVFSSMAAESVREDELRGTKAVHGLLGDERFKEEGDYAKSLEPVRDLSPGAAVEFFFRIGLELVGARPKPFSLEPGELAWEAHVALSRGLHLAERWPAAFYEALELMRLRSGRRSWFESLNRSAEVVERWVDQLPDDSGNVIRAATAEFRVECTARSGET